MSASLISFQWLWGVSAAVARMVGDHGCELNLLFAL